MDSERYVITISEDHKIVRLEDTATGEIHEFEGLMALYDALGVLAGYRERDAVRAGEED